MEKKKAPALKIVFIILGILFLIVAAFMLVTAISYTGKYLESYNASFADMWSNSLQYVITQVGPYLGFGIVCLGIAAAIGSRQSVAAKAEETEEREAAESERADVLSTIEEKFEKKLEYLADNIDTTREVISIKIEEKEKRDEHRIKKMDKSLGDRLSLLEELVNEPVVAKNSGSKDEKAAEIAEEPKADFEKAKKSEKESKGDSEKTKSDSKTKGSNKDKKSKKAKEPKPPEGDVPPLYRRSMVMAMPDIPETSLQNEIPETSLPGETPETDEKADLLETFLKDDKSDGDDIPKLRAFERRDTFSKEDLFVELDKDE